MLSLIPGSRKQAAVLTKFQGGFDMLVLSRRVGEQIVVGGDIRLTVVAVQGKQVRIGISAPPMVIVDREEISERRFHVPGKSWGRNLSASNTKLPASVH